MTDALLLCILPRGLIQRDSQHLGLYQCVQRGVALADTHGAADFLRDNDTSEVVDTADDSGSFHI